MTSRQHSSTDTPAPPPPHREPPASPKPPRAARLWVVVIVVVAIVAGFAGGTILRWQSPGQTASATGSSRSTTEDTSDSGFYTCGMHPWVILPDPGLCPICHMDLTPLDPDKFTGDISIDPVVTRSIGVRIEPVSSGPVARTIRTVGTVAYDETRVRDVNIKVPGWIEQLYVDYEGAEVDVGDRLFEFYSPKLYSAQSEYLTALRMRSAPGSELRPEGEMDAERLAGDARVQLEYFDVTPEQIAALERSGEPSKTMTILSPHRGVVIAKHANEGMRVDQGMRVYQIADLSKVWVMVSLHEYQLPFVQVGQQAVMTLPYIPGQTFQGKVIYVYPYLDERTRQVRVRLEFENPGLLLKPGMFTNIELRSTLARKRTLAPRSAVIDTGERQVAFVSLGDGRFEPRDVRMGVQTDGGRVEIIEGLKPGEMVVTSGQFLLDSEASIRESLVKMIKGDLAADQAAVVEVAGASELTTLPPAVEAGISAALERYFAVGDRLAGDATDGTAAPARRIAAVVDELLETEIPEAPHFWHRHDEIATVRGKALEVAGAADIETARLAFADLSVALAKLVKATGVPPSFAREVQELHCPMYRDGQGGSTWLQPAGGVRNPFYGSVMLECFDERIALPVTGKAAGAKEPADRAKPSPGPDEPTAPPAADEPPPIEGIDGGAQEAIDELTSAYLRIQKTLIKDELEGVAAGIGVISDAAARLKTSAPSSVAEVAERLEEAATIDVVDLESFRTSFRVVSDTSIELLALAPPSASVAPSVYHAYCPMEKASWLQLGREIENPYAPYMLRCGSIKHEFEAVARSGGAP